MKHSIVLLSLLGCFAINATNRNAAAAAAAIVSSEADVKELTGIVLPLPGSTEADTKTSVAVTAPNWNEIIRNNDVTALNRAIAQGQVNVPYMGKPALWWIHGTATWDRQLDMLRTLLAAGANPNFAQHSATRTNAHTVLGFYIDGLDILRQGEKGTTTLIKTIKTMIFYLLNAGAHDMVELADPSGDSRAFTFFASAAAFHAHLFDVGALILEHGASAQERYTLGGSSKQLSLADLASIENDAQRHYANQAVRAGSRGRQARNACLANYKPTVRESLTKVLLPDLIRIVLTYAQPTCEHIHFTAFINTAWSKNLDYPLVKEDEWRKQKPGKAVAQIESKISGHRRDSEKEKPAPENTPQGCGCTIS